MKESRSLEICQDRLLCLEEEEKKTLAEYFKKLILGIFTKIKQAIKNIFSLDCISKTQMCLMYW